MLLLSKPLRLFSIALLCLGSIDSAVSFVWSKNGRRSNGHYRSLIQLRKMNMSPQMEDRLVLAGDAASLGLFSVVQSIVDPYEPSVAVLLGDDAVANYRLDLLANPLVASVVVIPCWLVAGLFSEAYSANASLRTTEESLQNVLRTYALYLPCVTTALFLLSEILNGTNMIAAPDFTFCAGAISVIGSWRFTLANTIGK